MCTKKKGKKKRKDQLACFSLLVFCHRRCPWILIPPPAYCSSSSSPYQPLGESCRRRKKGCGWIACEIYSGDRQQSSTDTSHNLYRIVLASNGNRLTKQAAVHNLPVLLVDNVCEYLSADRVSSFLPDLFGPNKLLTAALPLTEPQCYFPHFRAR